MILILEILINWQKDPPWLNERIEVNGASTYYGLHVKMCDYLAEALNITYNTNYYLIFSFQIY